MKIYSKEAREYFKTLLGYEFKDWGLMVLAFTRSSFKKDFVVDIDTGKKYRVRPGNEALEFYGDKALYGVIGTITSLKYSPIPFDQDYFDKPQFYETVDENGNVIKDPNEIDLETKKDIELNELPRPELLTYISETISRNSTLAEYIRNTFYDKNNEHSIKELMLLGENDIKNNIVEQDKVLADLFESIIGAIAIDCKWNMKTLCLATLRLMNDYEKFFMVSAPGMDYHSISDFEAVTKNNCVEMMNLFYQKSLYGKLIFDLVSDVSIKGIQEITVKCSIPSFIPAQKKSKDGKVLIKEPEILGCGTGKGSNLKEAKRNACWEAIADIKKKELEPYQDNNEERIKEFEDDGLTLNDFEEYVINEHKSEILILIDKISK